MLTTWAASTSSRTYRRCAASRWNIPSAWANDKGWPRLGTCHGSAHGARLGADDDTTSTVIAWFTCSRTERDASQPAASQQVYTSLTRTQRSERHTPETMRKGSLEERDGCGEGDKRKRRGRKRITWREVSDTITLLSPQSRIASCTKTQWGRRAEFHTL